jgi:integrase
MPSWQTCARTVPLTEQGAAFLKEAIAGKDAHDLMFIHTSGRNKGEPWKRTQQTYHMVKTCKLAKIKHCGFHQIRHSYASHLKMARADSMLIAKLLGPPGFKNG